MAVEARRLFNETVVEVRGSFDAAEADTLQNVLLAIAPEQPVTLDFHGVRQFDDAAVARLAQDLVERRIALLGLSEHHHRLLRYMGVRRSMAGREKS